VQFVSPSVLTYGHISHKSRPTTCESSRTEKHPESDLIVRALILWEEVASGNAHRGAKGLEQAGCDRLLDISAAVARDITDGERDTGQDTADGEEGSAIAGVVVLCWNKSEHEVPGTSHNGVDDEDTGARLEAVGEIADNEDHDDGDAVWRGDHELRLDGREAKGVNDDWGKCGNRVSGQYLTHVYSDIHNKSPVSELFQNCTPMDLAMCAIAVPHHAPVCHIPFSRRKPPRVVGTIRQDPDTQHAKGDSQKAFEDEEDLPILSVSRFDVLYSKCDPTAEGSCNWRG
jgi:hypothetical protein